MDIKIKFLFFLIALSFIPTLTIDSFGNITFEEITNTTGINYQGDSYGASWGDFNGDGYPDLWTGNHYNIPTLYLNNRDGTFIEIGKPLNFEKFSGIDFHGASWADFDNDGDQDLIIQVGAERGFGEGSNVFLINDEGKMEDEAEIWDLQYGLGRGRTPLWFDWNNDGLLDIALTNGLRPDNKAKTAIFQQQENKFVEIGEQYGFETRGAVVFAQISDLNRDHFMDLIMLSPNSRGIYNFEDTYFVNIFDELLIPKLNSKDVVIADFNGDLLPDLYLTRKNDVSLVASDGDYILKSHFKHPNNGTGFEFVTAGNVNLRFYHNVNDIPIILVGAEDRIFQQSDLLLSPLDSENWGFPAKKNQSAFHIGYDKEKSSWKINLNSNTYGITNLIVDSDKKIENLTFFNSNPLEAFSSNILLFNSENGFTNFSNSSGINFPTSCKSVATGDFDNDMDLDIYLLCTTWLQNIENIFLENDGKYNFTILNSTNTSGSSLGIGDSVTVVDFNNDGFLDIFLTNGFGFHPYFDNGPYQLLRNQGNDNNWLEIDLEGNISNKDAIGSIILVKTDNVTQIREQSNGMHSSSQNHNRIHFGLGNFSLVENIVVYFPSGMISQMKNVPVNQILKIFEPTVPLAPKIQSKLGIEPDDVICKDGLIKTKKITNEIACVKPSTIPILEKRGWAY